MSGSDLAPFVSAVLKDRTVAGMIQENNELKSKLMDRDNERLLVEVTGQHGVHEEWSVHLKENDAVLPLILLSDLEIWLGGTLVHQFKYTTDNSTRLSWGIFQVDNIFGRIGPMLRTDYEELAMMNVTQLMDLYQDRPAPVIDVEYIMFNKVKILGTMALLEKLGIETMEPLQIKE
ncbi:hypothetical protein FRACYDRAFT_247392 [Fragilariopsis cylindrus CCMP1102]|uniref:Uncharacterized protein n=1 Tax=Fragilariopsis cylindrus CCMP1102 TaxID=635003 RepID=A0A1E7EX00_9STRA|nr:hypothetical protein FRACYDRAFT_247392 [Fragilariopsis cylindrus CCMP1102]|eukprot:OEU10359.1 hypothetical protein FRACYDRAFT_247392 [Fragilariopsis cylindrus CCMP1102]